MLLLPLSLALPASAQEYVDVRGALRDDDFYRVVACAAPPGGGCRKPFLRWSAARRSDLTVALVPSTGRLRGKRLELYLAALDAALEEVNALGSGIRLRRVERGADIDVRVVSTPPGRIMRATGEPHLDGFVLPLARVSVGTRQGEIRTAQIAISIHARMSEVPSILLEEVVQGLGLITDIRGPAYRRSVFAEDGNSAVRIEGQDAMALRRHYPAGAIVTAGRE